MCVKLSAEYLSWIPLRPPLALTPRSSDQMASYHIYLPQPFNPARYNTLSGNGEAPFARIRMSFENFLYSIIYSSSSDLEHRTLFHKRNPWPISQSQAMMCSSHSSIMATNVIVKQASGLMSLATETREMIYRHLLVSEYTTTTLNFTCKEVMVPVSKHFMYTDVASL